MPIDIRDAAAPSLMRRLAAIFYDAWLILALWLIGVTLDFALRSALGLDVDGAHLLLQIYLVACPFVFFGWFWTHGGQTLGMRAWRLTLLTSSGQAPGWRASVIRIAGACLSTLALGLGYFWVTFDREKLAWHDRISDTRVVVLKKS